MKHLFLSGRRMDDIHSIRAFFQSSDNKDTLYNELLLKYKRGSMDSWLSARGIEKGEDTLKELCDYMPSGKEIQPREHWMEPDNESTRHKMDRLRTTGWFNSQKDLFTDGHRWDMTATCKEELDEIIDSVGEVVEDGNEMIVDVFLCNVREEYEISPLQLSGDIQFIGFGQPTVRLDCSFRETIDLSLFGLSFEGVKLESSEECFLVNSSDRLRNCITSETVQIVEVK